MADARNARGFASAADVLAPVWHSQVANLRFCETEVRLQRPDSVHRFRVATRRLRSNLSAFEPLLDATVIRSLQEGLRRTAAEVGGTRDVEIIRERIERLSVAGDDPGTAATVPLIMKSLDSAQVVSWERGQAHLDSPEYDKLTRALDAFSDLPPWLPAAESSSAEEVLRPILRAEWSRFRHRARTALDPTVPVARIQEARKAAKRARYVSEALAPALGKKARRIAKATQQLQEALGEYQDCVIVQAFLSDFHRDGRIGEEQLGVDQLRVLDRMRALEASTAAARRADFVRLFVEVDQKPRRKRES